MGVVDLGRLPGVRPPPHRRERRPARLPDGLRRHRRPGVPGAGRVRGGARAGRARHHARRGVGRDERRRHPARARGRLPGRDQRLRARRDPVRRLLPPHRGHRRLGVAWPPRASRAPARATRPRWALRAHGIPVSLSMDTSVWWSGDLFSAMRATLGADRSREHLEAHAKGDTVTNHALRAEQVVEWATLGGAAGAGPRVGPRQRRGRQEGRPRAAQERPLAGVVPDAQPARPRRVPGPARRRAHRAGERAGGEVRAPPRRTSTWPRPGARSRRRSSTCAPRSARRRGRRA